jgi:poly-gamma-glutamate synthesis protein (capsule biosynthesis protein)
MSTVTILAVGDTALANNRDENPFLNVRSTLAHKDILFGNLEVSLSESKKRAKKAHVIWAQPRKAQFLRDAGFDILNVANNHILDLGVEGFRETLESLDRCGLHHIGASVSSSAPREALICKAGTTIGFLGYTIGRFRVPRAIRINKLKRRDVLKDIDRLKQECDVVVVSLHWGTENVYYPSPGQIRLAHELVDRGATLVLGHHPHVIQGVEEYKNGLIAYSLGNFYFDPAISYRGTRASVVLRIDLEKTGVRRYELIPVEMNEDLLPTLVEGPDRSSNLDFIQHLSRCVSEDKISSNWWFEEISEAYLTDSVQNFSLRSKRYGIQTAVMFAAWLFLPFNIKCYAGLFRRRLKNRVRRN